MRKSMLLWMKRKPKYGSTIRGPEFARALRINRWLLFFVLIPVIAATTLLAIFFFAVFLALFVVVVVVVGLRVWWLHKFRHSGSLENFEDRHVVITKARVVEETDKPGEQCEYHARS